MASPTLPEKRQDILNGLTEQSKKLRLLAEKIDMYVECSSFLSSQQEISSLHEKVQTFNNSVEHMDKTFTELNSGLYDLCNDSDVVPCASQDPDERIQVETFEEKKQLSLRAISKTRIYLENPVYFASALKIVDSEDIYTKASKFLRSQWWVYIKTISKFFPEESNFPDPSEGLNCLPSETFEKLQMPLIKILDKLAEKIKSKRLANVEVHDNIKQVFGDINKKYEKLFEQTLWEDEEWMHLWGGLSQV